MIFNLASGAADFEFDITATDPEVSNGQNTITFIAMRPAGTVTALNTPLVNPVSEASLKFSAAHGFSLSLTPDPTNDNQLLGIGWLAITGGFLGDGGGTRIEFGENNLEANFDFTAVRREESDPTPIPEPGAIVLLCSALLAVGGGARRTRLDSGS